MPALFLLDVATEPAARRAVLRLRQDRLAAAFARVPWEIARASREEGVA